MGSIYAAQWGAGNHRAPGLPSGGIGPPSDGQGPLPSSGYRDRRPPAHSAVGPPRYARQRA